MTEVGEILRNEREKKGISLEQISQQTNINIKFLKALESEDFQHIPNEFYIKYYLKNYLQAIKIDSEAFFETHKDWLTANCLNKQEKANQYIPKLRYSRFKRKGLSSILYAILILVIFTSGFFYLYKKKIIHGWIIALKSSELPQTGIKIENTNKQFSPDRAPVNIRIDFLDNCWTSIRRGNQEQVEKTYEKGDRLKISGYELFIYIGNPAAVKFYLNEKEVSYLKNLTQPERLEINPGTMEGILKK